MVAAEKKSKSKRHFPVYFPVPEPGRGPSVRNRAIYEAVKVDLVSFRAAAETFQVSPGRIAQILQQVETWLGKTGGAPTRSPRERVRISEFLHRARAEKCYAKLHHAFDEGVETRTDCVRIVDGKPNDRRVVVKTVKRDREVLKQAWKVEIDRHAFEMAGMEMPVSELTAAERIQEAGLILAEDLELAKKEAEQAREEGSNDEKSDDDPAPLQGVAEEDPAAVEPVVHPPAAEEAPPTVTAPQPPVSNESVPPSKEVATPSVAAAAPEPPKRKPRVIWELQHLTPGPGPVPPGEKLEIAVPRFDDFGRLRLTKMPCPELLDTFWETDSTGKRRWKPPIIVNGPPDMPCYQGVIPTPPNWNNINWMRENRRKWLERNRIECEKKEREAAEAASPTTPPPQQT